jgi:hypothetical protein
MGLSYRPASQATYAGGIDSLESILGLLKSLKNRFLYPSFEHQLVVCNLYTVLCNLIFCSVHGLHACAQAAIFFAKPYSINAGEASIVLWIAASLVKNSIIPQSEPK